MPNHPAAAVSRPVGRWRQLRRPLLVFLAFCLPAAFLLFRSPPLWRDYDGLIQIATRPGDMTLLQYPPAYPAFSRLHIYAAQKLGWGRVGPKTRIDLGRNVTLNDPGLRALLVTQQLALTAACTAFVCMAARSRRATAAATLLLLLNAAIFLPAQLISTEALSQSLLVGFAALGLRLVRAAAVAWWEYALYGLLLLLLVLTRHANAVFAGIAPLAFIGFGLRARGTAGVWSRMPWRQILALTVIGILSIEAADGTTRLCCRAFAVPYRETGMRGPSEKLGFVELMPPERRAAFIAGLQARAADPVVREAIPLLAKKAGWGDQRLEIERILRRDHPAWSDETVGVQADAYLGLVVAAYYRTLDPCLVRETLHHVWIVLAHSNPASVCNYYFLVAEQSVELYRAEPWMTKLTQGLSACSEEARTRIESLRHGRWFTLPLPPHGVILLLAGIGALTLLVRQGDYRRCWFALGLVTIAVVALLLTFSFVHFEMRFASVPNLLGYLALALTAATALDLRTS